jgi:hypothetical protein
MIFIAKFSIFKFFVSAVFFQHYNPLTYIQF